MTLVEAGVEFEDNRVSDISNIKEKLPFGQVPMLEIDGLELAQSLAAARYVARKYSKSDHRLSKSNFI